MRDLTNPNRPCASESYGPTRGKELNEQWVLCIKPGAPDKDRVEEVKKLSGGA